MEKIKEITCTEEGYPQKLLAIKNPPQKLYVKGNYNLLNKDSIAIVGSRDCTMYGWKQATKFAKEISKQGICIVSGMAIGIDSAAHLASCKQKGKTIAVLGCGFKSKYIKNNEEVLNSILENGGCVITEYEEKEEVKPTNFPIRNRIISGLSMGVLVVEAKNKSGSTITGRYAIEQNKKLFCIPRNVEEKNGVGTNQLIQKGAKLVITPQDILKEYGINIENEIGTEKIRKQKVKVPKKYRAVYDVLLQMPQNINNISRKSGLSIAETTQILFMLELENLVKKLPGNEFVKI